MSPRQHPLGSRASLLFRSQATIAGTQLFFALWAVCCGSGTPAGDAPADDAARLRKRLAELARQERTMTAEYPLARNPAPYLVVSLSGRSIELKAQGRTLRSLKVTDVRGPADREKTAETWALVDKKPLQKSTRPKITPGAGEQAAAAQQALWGPHRMPSDYDLICEGGKVLEIRGLPSEQSGSRISRALASIYLRSVDWYRHWGAPQDAPYLVQIWLTETDSQALFWSLPKQLNILMIR